MTCSRNLLFVAIGSIAMISCITIADPQTREALKNPLAMATTTAAARLSCPEANVVVNNTGVSGPTLFYAATGCDQTTQIECIRTSGAADDQQYYCHQSFNDRDLFVRSLVKNHAILDLKCPAANVTLAQTAGGSNPDGSSFVATGCKATATYRCEDVAGWWQYANYECKKLEPK